MRKKKKSRNGNRSYRVRVRVWHSADERYYRPGEVMLLGHLSAAQIERLVSRGVVELVEKEGEAAPCPNKHLEEEKDGANSVDGSDD